jgi:hypothetical protein
MLIPLILTWGDVFFTEIENRSTSGTKTALTEAKIEHKNTDTRFHK